MIAWGREGVRDAVRCALLMLLSTNAAFSQGLTAREQLRAHGEQEFRKDIVKVSDGVYVAVGYSMANVTLIVGASGTIIVDTTSKVDEALAKGEFRWTANSRTASWPWRAPTWTRSASRRRR